MTPVKQYNNYACVTACIESFLRDAGEAFDHKKFIEDNLDLFHGGEAIEGSCDSDKIIQVAARIELKAEIVTTKEFEIFPPKEGAILLLHWEGKDSDKHCVRLIGQDDHEFIVMNPVTADFETIPKNWIQGIIKLTKP